MADSMETIEIVINIKLNGETHQVRTKCGRDAKMTSIDIDLDDISHSTKKEVH